MYIEINYTLRNESIKKNILEHNIKDILSYVIEKFKIPLHCFAYSHETTNGNVQEILHIEADTEEILIFYFKAIISYCGFNFTDFINLYLRESNGVINCIVCDNDKTSRGICITAEKLNDCLGKSLFNSLYRY